MVLNKKSIKTHVCMIQNFSKIISKSTGLGLPRYFKCSEDTILRVILVHRKRSQILNEFSKKFNLAFHSLPFDRGGYLTYARRSSQVLLDLCNVAKCMTWQVLVEYDVIKKIDDVRNELVRGLKYSICIHCSCQLLFRG